MAIDGVFDDEFQRLRRRIVPKGYESSLFNRDEAKKIREDCGLSISALARELNKRREGGKLSWRSIAPLLKQYEMGFRNPVINKSRTSVDEIYLIWLKENGGYDPYKL